MLLSRWMPCKNCLNQNEQRKYQKGQARRSQYLESLPFVPLTLQM